MEKLFIGIDISKDVFDYCVLTQDNQILERGQQTNTEEGIERFCNKVKNFKNYAPWICMEHTGYYGYLLATEFTNKDLVYSLLSPLDLRRSMGLVRGKNDAIDAYRIASYALSHQHKLKRYILPRKDLQKLKVLMRSRKRYSKISTQLKNALSGLRIANKTIDLPGLIVTHSVSIKQQSKVIKELDKQMLCIIRSSATLNKTYKQVTGVIGIGQIAGISSIVETMNFTKFTDPNKYACHSGHAPFAYRSGSSVRGKARTSHLCNKYLKGIYYKAACTAIQHDPQLKKYYQRKLAEGKHKLSVLNAVANKLIHRIFAVAKRDTPYVKLNI